MLVQSGTPRVYATGSRVGRSLRSRLFHAGAVACVLILAQTTARCQSFFAPYTSVAPTIDGSLTGDPGWAAAAPQTVKFSQTGSGGGSLPVTVYMVHDGSFLYVGLISSTTAARDTHAWVDINGNGNGKLAGVATAPHIDIRDALGGPAASSVYGSYSYLSGANVHAITAPAGTAGLSDHHSNVQYEFKIPLADLTLLPGGEARVGLMVAQGLSAAGSYNQYEFPANEGAAGSAQGWTVTQLSPALGGVSDTICFLSNRDTGSNHDVYLSNLWGAYVRRVTFTPGVEKYAPRISPDGTRIVYGAGAPSANIYIVNSDGTGLAQLTTDGATNDNDQPAWCGNDLIIFRKRLNGSEDYQLYKMNPDGSHVASVTKAFNATGYNDIPACSLDGTLIAWQARTDQKYWLPFSIWAMHSDGSDPHAVTTGAYDDEIPCWSPDGQHIAFVRNSDFRNGAGGVWVVNPDGSNPIQLTIGVPVGISYIAWTSSSNEVLFQNVTTGSEICGVNVATHVIRNLTNLSTGSNMPAGVAPSENPGGVMVSESIASPAGGATRGGSITYSFSVINATSAATGNPTDLIVQIPSGVTFESASNSGWTVSGNSVIYKLGALAAGSVKTPKVLIFHVPSGTSVGTVINCGCTVSGLVTGQPFVALSPVKSITVTQ